MFYAWKHTDAIWHLTATATVVIRNRDDTFCTPDLQALPFKEKISFLELPGQHDDCWINPKPYADVVQSYV